MSELPLYHFNNLSAFTATRHFISGRKGGVSSGETGELNLSSRVDDSKEHVSENRKRVASAMGVPAEKLVIPAQTHSDHIAEVTENNYADFFNDTDALITRARGICITVLSADCVPVLLYDPSTHCAAAVHAGWRGTVALIIPKAVRKMQELYGADASQMRAGIGPSICGEVYEVGGEVAAAFGDAFTNRSTIVKPKQNGKYLVDLWEANRQLLVSAGLKNEHIEISGICTYTNPGKFFSARRSANKAGRFGAGIVLL